MAVLIQGIALVVPVAKLEEHIPGGTKMLLREVGTRRFCRDGSLVAVALGKHDRGLALSLTRWFFRAGLVGSRFGYWKDLAFIYQKTASPTLPCDWLYIGRTEDGVVFATLDSDDLVPFEIMVPADWTLEDPFKEKVNHVNLDQLDEKFEFVDSDNTADIYRDRETGNEIRAALTRSSRIPQQPILSRIDSAGEADGSVQHPRYHQMPGNAPRLKEKKPIFDKVGAEMVDVTMGFADFHELDENAEEGDYEMEGVLAVQVAPNRYRLEQNPMWTEMATFHDVVEGEIVDDEVYYVQRVVENSGLKTIRTGVPPYFYFSNFGKGFLERVIEAGGMWGILFWGILVFNVPEDRYDEFERLYSAACREARLLEKSETSLPSQLYRQQPAGGSVRGEDEN